MQKLFIITISLLLAILCMIVFYIISYSFMTHPDESIIVTTILFGSLLIYDQIKN